MGGSGVVGFSQPAGGGGDGGSGISQASGGGGEKVGDGGAG